MDTPTRDVGDSKSSLELERAKTADLDAVAELPVGPVAPAKGDESFAGSHVPWTMKLLSVLLVTAVGFGSHWSSGVTGAMKSTLKKVCSPAVFLPCTILTPHVLSQQMHINNAQYAVLEASEDFMKSALILVSGIVTDRIGGAGSIFFLPYRSTMAKRYSS